MIYAFIRWWATIFLRLYFRKTIISGLDKVPADGPLILASNHPSAFLEASILSTVMKRPIHFLVRGDMFHPRFRWLFDWTKQIPIYRQKDGITNLRKNASSFDLTYKKLGEGESVLIFPEAKTILEKKMRPIQRGTAHLAFGTLPYIKNGETLMVQPVGVNFTEPRLPGTDVVIKFGEPFATPKATREDRDAIDEFTNQLSNSLSPLIVQIEDGREKIYDVLASIYMRMIYDNLPAVDAHKHLMKIASTVNALSPENVLHQQAEKIAATLKQNKVSEGIHFPDLVVLNKAGLAMMLILKLAWLIAGGWIWRLVRNTIFRKIKTDTFQSPTTIGVFMVVMPLVSVLLLIVFLIIDIPVVFVLVWLLVMWAGTLIRAPLPLIFKLLLLTGTDKIRLKDSILNTRKELEKLLKN